MNSRHLIVRHLVAGCLVLASAAAGSATYAQRVAPVAPVPAHIPPPAPSITPPIAVPPPAAAPALSAPAAPSSSDYAKAARSLDDSIEENERRAARSYEAGGSAAGSVGAAVAPAPEAPSFSDLCRASPKPPWCEDEPATPPKN